MTFHISREGRQYGPYTAEAIRAYLADGSLLASDKVCEEGGSVWRPMQEVFPPDGVAPPKPFETVSAGTRKTPPLPPPRPEQRRVSVQQHSAPQMSRPAVVLLLAGCFVAAALAGGWFLFLRPGPTVSLLEGSTTIGDGLASALLKSFLRSEGATSIEDVSRSDPASPHHDVRAKWPGDWRPTTYTIMANGSPNAFKALAAGRAEIGMASRPVNDEEIGGLLQRGDLRSPECENIVGLDGVAIVVNRANPLDGLTRPQLASIFRGKITDWSEVGGTAGPIHLYGRASTSGTFDTFADRVFAGDKKGFTSSLHVLDNGEAIARTVAGDAGGIGYVSLAQQGPAKALDLSDGSGTASLRPSTFTVATEDYILSRRLFLYSLPTHSEFAAKFIAYALSPEGQAIVETMGFTKQIPVLETVIIPDSLPLAYRREVSGMRRMRLNFRFKSDSKQLDNKALADLPRAFNALKQQGIRTGVVVLGFADSRGTANQRLSEERAQVVSAQLSKYGIEARPVGLSSIMPVGDNATPEGQQKNRRVELWAR